MVSGTTQLQCFTFDVFSDRLGDVLLTFLSYFKVARVNETNNARAVFKFLILA